MTSSSIADARVTDSALPSSSTGPSQSNYKLLRVSCWVVALALGAAQAWANRFTMNPDGISYLDIGDAYWRGDWHNAINAYWSPLYSWILGFFLKVLRPSPYWEYPLVHLVNFLIFAAALACFEFFLSSFVTQQQGHNRDLQAVGEMGLSQRLWYLIGYGLFVWTSLAMVGLAVVSPDILVFMFTCLDCALLLRIRLNPDKHNFVYLGIALGVGYLAKAILFPLGFVFLATAALSAKTRRHVVVSGVIFLVTAGPFITSISFARQRLTFGESGRITYAAYIDGVQPWFPGDGGQFYPEGIGHAEHIDQPSEYAHALLHPVRRIVESPATYYFDGSIEGTYPFWYDVSYWQDGIKAYFRMSGLRRVFQIAVLYGLLLIGGISYQLAVTTGLMVLFLVAPKPSACFKRVIELWYLLVPVVAGLLMYATVHFEYRFVAPFVCVGWIAFFSGVRLPISKGLRIFLRCVVLLIAGQQSLSAMALVRHNLKDTNLQNPTYWRAAQALEHEGLVAGDKIAMISDQPWGEGGPFVARLARLRIVGQVNQPAEFWKQTSLQRSEVLEALANSGAKAVVSWGAKSVPNDWKQLGGTDYFVFSFLPHSQTINSE